jgi:phosphate-selective porin OprO/OprP
MKTHQPPAQESTMNRCLILAALILAPFAPSAYAQDAALAERVDALEKKLAALDASSATALNGAWKNGYVFASPDNAFKLQFSGRLQLDAAFFDADEDMEAANGAFNDGVDLRRMRLALKGTMYHNVDFILEYDFGTDSFASTYITLKNVPTLGNIRVGNIIEPMGLEELCSNNHITFLERGTITAFNPVYNMGVMAFNTALDKRATWALGVFKDTGGNGDSVSNEAWAVTTRITGLPYAANDDRRYLHLGASASLRDVDRDSNSYRIRSRPMANIAPYVVNTGNLPADQVTLTGLEALYTLDSVSLQSEWMLATVERTAGDDGALDDVDFSSFYVQASWFITGEHRPYNRSGATPSRIKPNQNATGKAWGAGAWELAARFDRIDLTDGDVTGGEMDSVTLGLNWYLNPFTRVMLNYINADVEDEGTADILATRLNIEF